MKLVLIGGIAAVGALTALSLPEIKRYLKVRKM